MANKYNFLPDFSMFDTADQNDATTEDTSSSLMTRSSKADADPAASREEFLKSFYDNLRSSFETEDMFRKTFPSRKRPKPNQSEIEDYISRSTRAKGIDDALFEATGMYKAGTPSDAGMMSLEDAPDGITVPKQPEIQVEELSSAGSTGSIGEYLRTRKNKGSSFVGEGVEVADTSNLTTEQVDLAKRLAAKRRMEADAAKMNVPVVDMGEEERKALEYAKTIPKLSTLKGVGIMSPKKEEPEVEAAEETTSVVEAEVETAEESTKPLEGMGAQAAGFFNKAESEGFNIINDNVGMSKGEWEAFKKEVAKIESGGKKDPYRISGGANKHYDGKYQMGKLAKQDAADLLGMGIGHSKSERDSFRNNPALQERAFAAFTAKNHKTLMDKSEIYRSLSKKQQSAVLGYAHNQGATAASKWLSSGKVGSDKFKTKGTKYSDAIASVLGVKLPKFGSSDLAPKTSLRPKARPDTRVTSN